MNSAKIKEQIERFSSGFDYLDIVSAATPDKGIKVLSSEQVQEAIDYLQTAEVDGKCKFVPASGAASRMFKDIYAGMQTPNQATEKLAQKLESFAFYNPEVFL